MLNDYIISKIDDMERDGGYYALKKEVDKVELYIRRCSKDPSVYGDLQDRKDYLAELKSRLIKFPE